MSRHGQALPYYQMQHSGSKSHPVMGQFTPTGRGVWSYAANAVQKRAIKFLTGAAGTIHHYCLRSNKSFSSDH